MTQSDCPIAQASGAARWIQAAGWEQMIEQIESGKTFLVVIGDEILDLLDEERSHKVGDFLRSTTKRPVSISISNLEKPYRTLCEIIEEKSQKPSTNRVFV